MPWLRRLRGKQIAGLTRIETTFYCQLSFRILSIKHRNTHHDVLVLLSLYSSLLSRSATALLNFAIAGRLGHGDDVGVAVYRFLNMEGAHTREEDMLRATRKSTSDGDGYLVEVAAVNRLRGVDWTRRGEMHHLGGVPARDGPLAYLTDRGSFNVNNNATALKNIQKHNITPPKLLELILEQM